MMRSIVWANCFLGADDVVYESFSRLGEILAESGMLLVMFSPAGDYSRYRGFTHFSCSLLVSDTGRTYRHFLSSRGLPMGSSGVQEFLALDHKWGGPPPSAEQQLLVLRALAFWEYAFDVMQPSVILSWGSSAPTARLLARLGQRCQRPTYIIERGPIPKTLMLSLSGQVSLSGSTTYPALISPSFDEPALVTRWEIVKEFLLSDFKIGYPDRSVPVLSDDALALKADTAPRVLFLGNYDIGSGCAFSPDELGDSHGSWLRSSELGARLVHKVLEDMECASSLWVKPHPATPFALCVTESRCKVRNVGDLSIPALVEAADICVALTSTTQIYPIVFEKPLVSLANGFLMGRHIAYEVTSQDLLQPMLAAALARDDLAKRCENGQALLAALCERDLFGLHEAAPTRLRLGDLATLLSRFRNYSVMPDIDVVRRITHFDDFLTYARGSFGLRVESSGMNQAFDAQQECGSIDSAVQEAKSRAAEAEARAQDVQRALELAQFDRREVLRKFEDTSAMLDTAHANLVVSQDKLRDETVKAALATEQVERLSAECIQVKSALQDVKSSMEAAHKAALQAAREQWNREASSRLARLGKTALDALRLASELVRQSNDRLAQHVDRLNQFERQHAEMLHRALPAWVPFDKSVHIVHGSRRLSVKRLVVNLQTSRLVTKGDEANRSKNWPLAAVCYARALAKSPSLAPIWVQYGHALKELGDRGLAEVAYREAIRLQPNNPDTHLHLGHLLKLLGRVEAARAAFQRSAELDPSQVHLRRELAVPAEPQGKPSFDFLDNAMQAVMREAAGSDAAHQKM